MVLFADRQCWNNTLVTRGATWMSQSYGGFPPHLLRFLRLFVSLFATRRCWGNFRRDSFAGAPINRHDGGDFVLFERFCILRQHREVVFWASSGLCLESFLCDKGTGLAFPSAPPTSLSMQASCFSTLILVGWSSTTHSMGRRIYS